MLMWSITNNDFLISRSFWITFTRQPLFLLNLLFLIYIILDFFSKKKNVTYFQPPKLMCEISFSYSFWGNCYTLLMSCFAHLNTINQHWIEKLFSLPSICQVVRTEKGVQDGRIMRRVKIKVTNPGWNRSCKHWYNPLFA